MRPGNTAEDAKVHRGKSILKNLCEPLRPAAVDRLVPTLCGLIYMVQAVCEIAADKEFEIVEK